MGRRQVCISLRRTPALTFFQTWRVSSVYGHRPEGELGGRRAPTSQRGGVCIIDGFDERNRTK